MISIQQKELMNTNKNKSTTNENKCKLKRKQPPPQQQHYQQQQRQKEQEKDDNPAPLKKIIQNLQTIDSKGDQKKRQLALLKQLSRICDEQLKITLQINTIIKDEKQNFSDSSKFVFFVYFVFIH